jgi:hypothetical protein
MNNLGDSPNAAIGDYYNFSPINTTFPDYKLGSYMNYYYKDVSTPGSWTGSGDGIYISDKGTTDLPIAPPATSIQETIPVSPAPEAEEGPARPRLIAGDTVYTKFLRGARGPFILIQPTSMMLDEDTGCKSGKLQRVAVEDAWTVQDAEGKTFAFPAALLTRVPPMKPNSLWSRITSPHGLEVINMSLLAILSALTSGCMTAGIYMLATS